MESGRPVTVDPQENEKSVPEVRGEDRIAIGDDVDWQSVGPDHMLNEEGGHVRSRHGFRSRNENRHLGKAIHDD